MIERVHHIDFVVRNLDEATARYSRILGREPSARERLEDRGVELVRFEVGNIWIILVQPVRDDSPVKDFLDKHGEGFFHIAYKVKNVVEEAERIKSSGVRLINEEPRAGVEGWKLIDLAMEDTIGVMTQLIEEDI
jgi:methylmalonyl-CoA/ethylmalonyl-CoA epimerase